jgi:hypothetical protein
MYFSKTLSYSIIEQVIALNVVGALQVHDGDGQKGLVRHGSDILDNPFLVINIRTSFKELDNLVLISRETGQYSAPKILNFLARN